MDPHISNVIIAVMGMTGAGKSSFIKNITGRKDIRIGHGLSSETEKVTPYQFNYAGTNFTLVDTPGFNDNRYSDDEIANRILDWLRRSMNQDEKLSGIIYVHSIMEPRMQGTALSNMNMFRSLCGPDCFPNVVLATSFWNDVNMTEGARREQELTKKDEFWGKLVKNGSRVVRIGLDDNADKRLLLEIARNKKVILQAQQEMKDGKQNCETSAAQEVNCNLSEWKRVFDAQLKADERKLRRELSVYVKQGQARLKAEIEACRAEEQKREQSRRQCELEEAARKTQQIEEKRRKEATRQLAEIEEMRKARRIEAERSRAYQQERQRFYAKHKCIQTLRHRRVVCNGCRREIKHDREQFYHCCHCDHDDFDLCIQCGPDCKDDDHPAMKLCGGRKR